MTDHERSRYALAGLGDLVQMLVEGWQVAHMYYADRCDPLGPEGVPAAFMDLRRAGDEHAGLCIPADGRAFSHESLVALFREQDGIWKHRTPESFPELDVPSAPPQPVGEWAEPVSPFPDALVLGPATLRDVLPVNQTQTVDDLAIAITSLERFVDGARARYLAQATGHESRAHLKLFDPAAIDDCGRMYQVVGVDEEVRGNHAGGAILIAPAPPRDCRRLTLTIGTVGAAADDPAAAAGPWVFPITLNP